jgi:predicted AAA+ superfamily ATPase
MAFGDYPLVSLDSPIEREQYERLTPEDWLRRFPRAVIDEVQKLPSILETIKACYDRAPHARYVLLGSSQILLMKGIRESLAGRVALQELFPFSLPELCAADSGGTPIASPFARILAARDPARELCLVVPPDAGLSDRAAAARARWSYFLAWGGMPALLGSGWSDDDRFAWLADYFVTYLQRDLGDLARIDRLEPFTRVMKAAAARSAQLVNFSDLARLSGVSSPTAQQFLRYLELSYQTILVPAWHRNQEKRLSKQPKLHFLDPGARRAIMRKRGDADGAEFESACAAEIHKQCRTLHLGADLFHLHSADGREIDILLEREDGFVAVECKQTAHVDPTDARHFRGLEAILDKPVLLGIVVSNEIGPRSLSVPGCAFPVWAVPAPLLFA